MPPRRLVVISLCAALVAFVAVALLYPRGHGVAVPGRSVRSPEPGPGAWAYVTEKQLVLMEGNRTVARVSRFSDDSDPHDYKTVWTRSGSYLVMFSDTRVRQEDPSETQLIVVSAASGAVRRVRCPYCFDFSSIGANGVLAESSGPSNDALTFLTFDLDRDAPSPTVTDLAASDTGNSQLLVSSATQVLTSGYGGDVLQHLTLRAVDGSTETALGAYDSNDYMPVAVSGASPATFAVAFRENPGSCGPFPIYVFTEDGKAARTDMSDVANGEPTDGEHGVDVDDIWWGIDGHFHAAIGKVTCTQAKGKTATAPSITWRLDGNTWLPESTTKTTMLRPLDVATNAVLVAHDCSGNPPTGTVATSHCNTGLLYYQANGTRTVLLDDVLSISAPTPQSPLISASSLPAVSHDAKRTLAPTTGPHPAHSTTPTANLGTDQPSLSTTNPHAVRRFAPYVGTWTQHGYTLSIAKNFTGKLIGLNAPDPSDQADYQESATFSFTVSSSGITAHVESASNPNGIPWYLTGQDVPLRRNDVPGVIDLGDRHFCGSPGTYPWDGLCGA